MSDREFDELFEKPPDWSTAVANLREIIVRDKSGTDERLTLLKDTALDTMLAILADRDVSLGVSHNRWTGGELEIKGSSFHVFVFRKAFWCWRADAVSPERIASVAAAREALAAAEATLRKELQEIPHEMRRV